MIQDKHSAPSRSQARQAPLLAAVFLAFLALTGLYAALGYLGNIGDRIAPVDSAYYYMYLPSLLLEGDLDFHEEVERQMGSEEVDRLRTPLDRAGNPYPVGPALFWTPGFLLAHGISLAASLPVDGFGPFYQGSVYVLNALYGALGLLLLAAILRRFVDAWPAFAAVLTVLLATQLSYYLWSHTAMSHALSFFAVGLFFWAYLRTGASLWTALAAGLMFLVRWQDVLYALPLAWDCLAMLGRAFSGKGRKEEVLRCMGCSAVFLLACVPQMLVWNALYGSPVTVPTGQQHIDLLQLHPLRMLFSLSDGLFTWTPVALLGFVGLGLLFRRDRGLALKVWLAVLAQLVFISSLQNPSGGSYGMRFFTGGMVFTGLGLGLLLQYVWKRWVLLAGMLVLLATLSVFNQLHIYQFQYGLVPHSRELVFAEFITDKFRLGQVRQAEEHYLAGRQRYLAGDMQGFHRHMQRANELASGKEKLLLGLGFSSLEVQDLQRAQRTFFRLHELRPQEGLYIEPLAALAFLQGRTEQAQTLLEKLDTARRKRLLERMETGGSLLGDEFRSDVLSRLVRLQY